MELTWAEKIEARGREAGLEAGFSKGQEAGFTKGQEAGLLAGAREIISRQLEDRFGKPPRRVNERLLQVEDMSRLQALATRLLRAESLDELDLSSGS